MRPRLPPGAAPPQPRLPPGPPGNGVVANVAGRKPKGADGGRNAVAPSVGGGPAGSVWLVLAPLAV